MRFYEYTYSNASEYARAHAHSRTQEICDATKSRRELQEIEVKYQQMKADYSTLKQSYDELLARNSEQDRRIAKLQHSEYVQIAGFNVLEMLC
jgi:uncharacterized protein involved in exopolysaccharide biosynthesis